MTSQRSSALRLRFRSRVSGIRRTFSPPPDADRRGCRRISLRLPYFPVMPLNAPSLSELSAGASGARDAWLARAGDPQHIDGLRIDLNRPLPARDADDGRG